MKREKKNAYEVNMRNVIKSMYTVVEVMFTFVHKFLSMFVFASLFVYAFASMFVPIFVHMFVHMIAYTPFAYLFEKNRIDA